MKIAYVSDSIYPYIKGGIEKRIWEFSTRLSQKGHEIHIYGPKYWDGESLLRKDGIYLHGIVKPSKKRFVYGRRSITDPIYFACRILIPLLKDKFDVIDCPIFPFFPCYTARLVSLIKGTPLVINWFELWDNYWYEYLGKKGIFGKIIERSAIKLPHKIIVESEVTKQGLIKWGYNPNKITIIPSGVAFKKIQNIPHPPQEENKTDVIYVGRQVKYKGVHTIIESIAHLRKNRRKVTASLVGDGPERQNLESLAKELKVEDRVKFYGLVEEEDDVISLMKGAKLFIYAATPLGGWALTPIEANACGLPVITTRSGPLGDNEVVIDGYNGLLVENELPELIAEKIALILENHQLRVELQKNGLEFARSYDWDNQVEAVEKFYLGCLKTKDDDGSETR